MDSLRIARALMIGALSSSFAHAQDSISIVSGDKQAVRRAGEDVPGGVAAFAPLSVAVKDAQGKPLAGVSVAFECGNRAKTLVCQLESFEPVAAGKAPVPAQFTPSGWATTRGQLVAVVEGATSARSGAMNILKSVAPTKMPPVRVLTDERGVATLRLMRGNSAWAYGADGDLVVSASTGTASADFKLSVRK